MTDGWAIVMLEKTIIGEMAENYLGWLYLQQFLPPTHAQAFSEQVSDYTQSRFDITVSPDDVDLTYSVALHDAVMLYAHAATKVLSEGGELHNGSAVAQAVLSTKFEGVGGTIVALDDRGDRIESYEVMNYVMEANGAIGSVPVGAYSTLQQQYEPSGRAVLWPGRTAKVPVAYASGAHGIVRACSGMTLVG